MLSTLYFLSYSKRSFIKLVFTCESRTVTQPDDEQALKSEIASLRLDLISLQTSEAKIKQRIAEIDRMIQSVLEEDSGSQATKLDNNND